MANLTEIDARFIPLRANGKAPSENFKGKTFTTEYLLQHSKKGGNIGLLSQPDLIFIDIDTHRGIDGMANFKAWLIDNQLDPDEVINGTLSQTTPTGGIHLIYKKPTGLTFTQDIGFLENVDIKASDNNYIVFYPSMIDGKPYTLNNNDTLELPRTLAEALNKAPQQKATVTTTGAQTATQSDSIKYLKTRYGDKLDPFHNVMHGWGTEGSRNVTIFKWAQRMRNITDYNTCIAFAEIANRNSADPYPEYELEATIRSAYEFKPEPLPDNYTEPASYAQFRAN